MGNGDEALRVERARFQEPYRNRRLELAASHAGGVGDECDEGSIGIRRVHAHDQGRSDFRRHAEIDQPHFATPRCRH